jgi:chromosome transmission fidelity protein 8
MILLENKLKNFNQISFL